MYARVRLTVANRENTLVVPRNALMDIEGRRGVFVPMAAESARASSPPPAAGAGGPGGGASQRVRFVQLETGIEDPDYIEVTRGLTEGQQVVTTGAAALRDGDAILLARQPGGRTGPASGAASPLRGAAAAGGQQAQRAR
jgi:hypothetical protein